MSVFEPINDYYDEAIPASQNTKTQSSLHAVQYLENYLNGIISQWNRIVSATYQWPIQMAAKTKLYSRTLRQEELDFHFYLICWDKVRKYFTLIEKLEKDEAISKVYRKVSELLYEAKKGRDFYEHLDEEFKRGGIGTRGRGFSYPEGYHFSYVRVKSGLKVERKVKLGIEEISRIREAYRELIILLNARK